MGSGAFLVAACRFLARRVRSGAGPSGRLPSERHRRSRACADPADDRRALPVRRRPQPDGGAARPSVALAGDARRRPSAQLSRSSPAGRRQPARHLAVAAAPAAADSPAAASRATRLPLFDDERRRRRAARGAADPLLRWRPPRRHASSRCARRSGRFAALDRARRGASPLEADRGPLVRARGSRPTASRRRPRRSASLSDAVLTGRGALPSQTADTLSRRRRCRRRRASGSFIGSSSFLKCSSTRTARGGRTPDSTPSSAIRRGT